MEEYKDLKTKIAQMQIVDDTLTGHGIPARFTGENVSLTIADLAKLIIRLQDH